MSAGPTRLAMLTPLGSDALLSLRAHGLQSKVRSGCDAAAEKHTAQEAVIVWILQQIMIALTSRRKARRRTSASYAIVPELVTLVGLILGVLGIFAAVAGSRHSASGADDEAAARSTANRESEKGRPCALSL